MSDYFVPGMGNTWEDGFSECRLIAADGEVIARISYSHYSGEWRVASTGKSYVTREQAKAAAERAT